MAPSTKKRTAPVSDFKRVKAKVGKRAPKPANYTDTSFKKASLRVASQEEQQVEGVRSSRGRSLVSLAQQLGHVTTSIRQSAAKGILDILSNRQDRSWQAHLSIVLPAIGQCLVDMETTVRSVGLTLWQSLLDQTDETLMKPFWSVFAAFLSSALNSLDRRVRRDGRVVLESASHRLPLLVAPHVPKLLPAMMRLTEDATFQYHSQVSSTESSLLVSSSKRNRNGREVWLETLSTMLETIPKNNVTSHEMEYSYAPQWNFIAGDVSKNSLFIAGSDSSAELDSMALWWHENAGLGEREGDFVSSHLSQEHFVPESVAKEVWDKLRGLLLEIMESNNNTDTLSVWARATRALLRATRSEDLTSESHRIILHTQGLVLSQQVPEDLLGQWILTLTELSQILPESTELKRRWSWVSRVIDYILDEDETGIQTSSASHVRWEILQHLLGDTDVLQSKHGRKVVEHLIHNWNDQSIRLASRLYQVASIRGCQQIMHHMMDYCVSFAPGKDERILADVYSFLLEKIQDPQAVPTDLLSRFKPVWEKDAIAHYNFVSTQRLALSLLVNLVNTQQLPDEILTSLGRLCVNSAKQVEPCLSPFMITIIQDEVFDLRRSLALPKFLAFLMDSIGVTDSETVNDSTLRCASSYLLGSGMSSRKILNMLWPLWRTWLEGRSIVTQRVALSFLAVLATDDASQSFLLDQLPARAHHAILQALRHVLQREDRSLSTSGWFQPVQALLSAETWLWEPLLQTLAQNVMEVETVLINNLLGILRDIPPTSIQKSSSLAGIERGVQILEEATTGGPLRTATRELADHVKLLSAQFPLPQLE